MMVCTVGGIADPAPASTRHAINWMISGANPLPTLPTAVMANPTDIRTVRPYFAPSTPGGMFRKSREKPNAATTKPMDVVPTSKSHAYAGITGATTPCPIIEIVVASAMAVIARFSRKKRTVRSTKPAGRRLFWVVFVLRPVFASVSVLPPDLNPGRSPQAQSRSHLQKIRWAAARCLAYHAGQRRSAN